MGHSVSWTLGYFTVYLTPCCEEAYGRRPAGREVHHRGLSFENRSYGPGDVSGQPEDCSADLPMHRRAEAGDFVGSQPERTEKCE